MPTSLTVSKKFLHRQKEFWKRDQNERKDFKQPFFRKSLKNWQKSDYGVLKLRKFTCMEHGGSCINLTCPVLLSLENNCLTWK